MVDRENILAWIIPTIFIIVFLGGFAYISFSEIDKGNTKEQACIDNGGELILNDANKCLVNGSIYSILRLDSGYKVIEDCKRIEKGVMQNG